jgi:hypothetical protein
MMRMMECQSVWMRPRVKGDVMMRFSLHQRNPINAELYKLLDITVY